MIKMPIKKGNFILIDYVGRVKETDEVFDTTFEEVAKEKGSYKEGEMYEPKLIVVGEGWVLKALDENLEKFEIDKPATVEIPPEQAFGLRDPSKVRRVSLRRLTARGITPKLGTLVEVNGKLATVRTIGSGRVQLDFNLPLAGKTLIYEVTVRKMLRRKAEKVVALIHRRIPMVAINKFDLKIRKNEATITIPEEAFYVEGLQLVKRGIAADVQRLFEEITTLKFVEVFRKEVGEGPP